MLELLSMLDSEARKQIAMMAPGDKRPSVMVNEWREILDFDEHDAQMKNILMDKLPPQVRERRHAEEAPANIRPSERS